MYALYGLGLNVLLLAALYPILMYSVGKGGDNINSRALAGCAAMYAWLAIVGVCVAAWLVVGLCYLLWLGVEWYKA